MEKVLVISHTQHQRSFAYNTRFKWWLNFLRQEAGKRMLVKTSRCNETLLTDSSQYILKKMDVALSPRPRLHQDVSKDLYEVD